ncbi:MAG: type IX secretion system outer membrane channel protein PorV [Bacteroidales bacterium]|nr:type IX secretion system outer membrane channel protein PorV [Bacteroidales bacterium]
MDCYFGRVFLLISLLTGSFGMTFGQNGDQVISTGQQLNAIQVTVPFLTIAPDSRGGGMGDVGVATHPDINSQFWNPAKYPFIDGEGGVAVSYTPWLRKLIGDINLAYLSAYKRIDDRQVVSASLRYFSLGNIVFTNIYGQVQGQFNPNEFSLDAGYSRLLTNNFSGAIAFRFIRSDLTGGHFVSGIESEPGVAVAGDLAFYYQNDIYLSDKDSRLAFGLNISNMGNKIAYTANQDKAFIPINMRLGGALTTWFDEYNSLTLTADVNKLLVPTPPVYLTDSLTGNTVKDENGDWVIEYGKDPDVPVPVGMLRSFWDAPGVVQDDGSRSIFLEELHEFTYSIGLEYWYREQFAIRGGYFHEHATKGNRKFFTVGVGFKLNVFGLDFSYLIPVKQNNPLANTLRFTLSFEFN